MTRKILRLYILLLLVTGLLTLFAYKYPVLVEKVYAQSLYIWFIRPLSLVTGLLPFSLAELLIVSTVLYGVYKLVLGIRILIGNPRKFLSLCKTMLPRFFLGLIVIYLSFNLVWGLNYNRLSFAEINGITVQPASTADLKGLATALVQKANGLREQVQEDERGIMVLLGGIREMFSRADLGYREAAEIYPTLGGNYGRPKGVLLSRYWSYTGIGGMYFPFTAEANVNTNQPHWLLTATTTHEMAHQRGFAREDEANYIAYLTCIMHPDPDFQYSGVMLALIHTMNALYHQDSDAWSDVRGLYSDGVVRDIKDYQDYLVRHEGLLKRASTTVNDSYLKANRQHDGVESYGRMIDLLLAEWSKGD